MGENYKFEPEAEDDINEAFISVVAVWHNSRNPDGWKKRIDRE